MKIEVEGADVLVIKGAELTHKSYKPLTFLATHSPDLKKDSIDVLDLMGYVVKSESGDDIDEAQDLFTQPRLLQRATSCPS
jgi:hypothetical protein